MLKKNIIREPVIFVIDYLRFQLNMIRLLSLFFFTSIINISCYSQSKSETEEWILSKLNTYTTGLKIDNPNEGDPFETKKYKYIIKNEKLYINCIEGYVKSGNLKKFYPAIYIIPIWALILKLDNNSISIETEERIIKYYLNGKLISRIVNKVDVPLAIDGEPDLYLRLSKALKHLKEFYPKPINKPELF